MKKLFYTFLLCSSLMSCSSVKFGTTNIKQDSGASLEIKITQVVDNGFDKKSGYRKYEIYYYVRNIGESTSEWTKINFEAILDNGEIVEKSDSFFKKIGPNNTSEIQRFNYKLPFKAKISSIRASKLSK